jgi:hypothetical protein
MSRTTKCIGVLAGLSAVAAIGVAVAQGVPPNPLIANPALGAGQQSSQHTSMGETGVPGFVEPMRTAVITREPEVAVAAPEPAPAPVAAAVPEPAPAPVVMGAAPAPAPAEPEPILAARQDRN